MVKDVTWWCSGTKLIKLGRLRCKIVGRCGLGDGQCDLGDGLCDLGDGLCDLGDGLCDQDGD